MTADKRRDIKFAPREAFETILEWSVIPTFDLVLSYGDTGVVVVRRKIAPYKGVWALPGLRMFKPETIEDTLRRVAMDEVGVSINPADREFLGQFVGKFRTERSRQDLSTGYHIRVDPEQPLKRNGAHFSDLKVVTEIPTPMGSMYRYYLEQYFRRLEGN